MSQNAEPIISIGMPVFNGEKFISEAISSLLAQTESRFELIISDNFSTDDTYAICKSYAYRDSRIKLIKQKQNLGALANFKAVLALAKADYFLWAACDDIWSVDWLEKLLSIHDENTAIAFGSVENINENGMFLKNYKQTNLYKDSLMSKLRLFFEEDTRGKANIIYGMYKTPFIKKIGPTVLGRVQYADDMLFVFTLLQYGDIKFDQSTKLYKRIPDQHLIKITYRYFFDRVFLTDRVSNYFSHAIVVSKNWERYILFLSIPVKYFVSFLFNLRILIWVSLKKLKTTFKSN